MPALDFDVGHINVSVNDSTTEIASIKPSATYLEDDESAFAWHRDSYAFVCVTMLSDCTGMIGGETAMKTGTGEIMKIRGPTQVRHPPLYSKTGQRNTDDSRAPPS